MASFTRAFRIGRYDNVRSGYRSEVNAKYGFADSTDMIKIMAEAIRKGEKAPDNMRDLIDGVLTQRASQGLIQSRDDILEHLSKLGLETTRKGKKLYNR